jgi:hypothetical protein
MPGDDGGAFARPDRLRSGKENGMRKTAFVFVLGLALSSPAVASQAEFASRSTLPVQVKLPREVSLAKAAAERYRSVERALADGYRAPPPTPTEPFGHCASSPPEPRPPGVPGGGMGIHYEHPTRMRDNRLDIRKPEILNYELVNGRLRLVALEYFTNDADQNLMTASDRPRLFGRRFDGPMPGHHPGMGVHYDLHVWLWKANPNGMFAIWNPRVTCPTP